jgi:hypothetical protein
MSTERCKSLAVGPSSDLYEAGCVLTDLVVIAPKRGSRPMREEEEADGEEARRRLGVRRLRRGHVARARWRQRERRA